jgi:ornithine cyclodeaminase/alanine dehydrogenase-like protein (mu-crystallin family)
MLILSKDEVRQALPMVEMIAATKKAYAALSSGKAIVPLRSSLSIPPHEATSLFMPAYLQHESGEALTVKIVSLFPHNIESNLPLIHAAVLVLQADTGQPLALLEGASLTAIRTGAASGAATDILARPDSQVAGIFGAGVQSRTQLEAICSIRPIQKVLVFDPRQDQVLFKIWLVSDPSPPICSQLQTPRKPSHRLISSAVPPHPVHLFSQIAT